MVLLLFSNNNVEKNACQLAEKLYLFPKNADRPNIVFHYKVFDVPYTVHNNDDEKKVGNKLFTKRKNMISLKKLRTYPSIQGFH